MDAPTLFGHLHPVLVHFPIACLLLCVVFEWVALARRQPPYGPATRGLLISGLLLGIAAALAGFRLHAEYVEDGTVYEGELGALLERHQAAGIVALSAALLAVILGEVYRRAPGLAKKVAYLVVLHVAGAAVAVGADAGGSLHWGSDWLKW